MSDGNPLKALHNNLSDVIYCRSESLRLTLTTLLCRGHLLIEDPPGLGKTTLAKALARSLHLEFRRLQCTPDLMPADVTGINIYNFEEHKFHFMPGPIFTNILLADEINRATPRTQSALLEAMAEGTVSLDRNTHRLPEVFMVIATQNPIEFSGTYPLPEAQLDRFFMRISLGYPDAKQEKQILLTRKTGDPLDQLQAVMTEENLKALSTKVEQVPLSDAVVDYITDLVRATRNHDQVKMGAGPRGSLALMRAARAMTLLTGKKAVTPDTVQRLLEPVLAHRLIFNDTSLLDLNQRTAFWRDLCQRIPVPDFAQQANP